MKSVCQTSPGCVHCAAVTHSTQRVPLQCGVPPLQFVSPRHPTQRPVEVLQKRAFMYDSRYG